jgi:CheY-specific phosphatase CheX
MPENPKFQELAKRYGLEPVPESVARLTDLVSRQESDVELIAKIITQDPALTARLLRAANPRAASEKDYGITTVEDALLRTGTGCVLLLAMGAPLSFALVKTFRAMLGLKLETVNPKTVEPFKAEHVAGSVSFSGKSEGKVILRLSATDALQIAAKILGLAPEEIQPADVTDAIGEMLNIITGNFQSNLCDAGLNSKLKSPAVARQTDFSLPAISGGGSERMAFRAEKFLVYVDLIVNPWNDE